jgi:prepilin-type N-terminal cleavage/methylation domain-containing protein
MKYKAFTLMEIMVALAIVLILATLGIPTFKNVYENANAKVCETKLLTIQTGYDIYKMEHDAMPGSLSEIPYEYFNRAYAKIMQGKDSWKIKLAYFITDWKERGLAYAEPFLSKLVKGQRNLLICPSDKREQANKISYCINKKIKGLNAEDADRAIEGEPLVVDCNGDDTGSTSEFALGEPIVTSPHKNYSFVGASSSYSQGISDAGPIQVASVQGTGGNAGSGCGWKSRNPERCEKHCNKSAEQHCKHNKWKHPEGKYSSREACEQDKATNCINCFCQ